jgi:hypothetical protein
VPRAERHLYDSPIWPTSTFEISNPHSASAIEGPARLAGPTKTKQPCPAAFRIGSSRAGFIGGRGYSRGGDGGDSAPRRVNCLLLRFASLVHAPRRLTHPGPDPDDPSASVRHQPVGDQRCSCCIRRRRNCNLRHTRRMNRTSRKIHTNRIHRRSSPSQVRRSRAHTSNQARHSRHRSHRPSGPSGPSALGNTLAAPA